MYSLHFAAQAATVADSVTRYWGADPGIAPLADLEDTVRVLVPKTGVLRSLDIMIHQTAAATQATNAINFALALMVGATANVISSVVDLNDIPDAGGHMVVRGVRLAIRVGQGDLLCIRNVSLAYAANPTVVTFTAEALIEAAVADPTATART